MKWLSVASLLGLVFCAGCSIFGLDEGQPLKLRTDSPSYELREGVMISVTGVNISLKTIHFNRCMSMQLDALDGNRVAGTFTFPSCDCLCFDELEPGERLEFTVDLGWFRQYNDTLPIVPGHRYRLRFRDFYKDREAKKPLDAEARDTNRFELIAFTL